MSEFDQEDLGDVAEIHIKGEFDCGFKIKAPEFKELEIPPEFNDYLKILKIGAEKHGANNWLNVHTGRASFIGFHDAIHHHDARSFAAGPNGNRQDPESLEEHLLHLICDAQMLYTKIKRGHYK